jgi:hypothetical protein
MKNDQREEQNIADSNPEKVKEMQKILVNTLKSFPGRPYGELVK